MSAGLSNSRFSGAGRRIGGFHASSFGFGPLALLVFASIAILLLGASASRADVCSNLRSQLRSGEGRNDAQVAQLRRQLAAIQRVERQRQCSARKSTGGLFDACGDLARRRASVQRQISAASGSNGAASALRARLAALGCEKGSAGRGKARRRPGRGNGLGGYAILFCVRLSDGYYFPTPNSQFASKADLKTTLDQCRYICGSPDVDVYALADVSSETEDMISVEGRKAYRDLAAAFKYRDSANFETCDFARYHKRVDEFAPRSDTPFELANAAIPLPTPRPEPDTATPAVDTENEVSSTSPDGAAATRHVRVVGPEFFPN